LAVEDSAVCVIVVDAREGITPLDSEVIKRVRESGVACVIAANKCDNADDDWRAAEFERFGLPVFATSAEHGRGVETLISNVVSKLPPAQEDESKSRPLRVAVVGRPNAGKSSYVNRLLNAPRVIVSEIAGTTRDAVEVPFSIGSGPEARHYMLVDTAGMKQHTRMSKTSVDNFSLFRSEQAIAEADVVLLLLDAKMGPTMQDKRIAGKILEANRACVILCQKWDLAQEDGVTETKALPALRQMMPFLNFAPVVFCSNKSGYNIRKTVSAIDRAAVSAGMRLPTGMLNRVLVSATKKTLSPMIKGKRLKIYYGLQVSTNPQTIRLFVNDPKLVTPAYLSFLEKNIRARFGLEGAPLRIFLKARSRNSSNA
jgi:GTP-binding protein